MAKFLLALLVVYAGWLLWRGPRKPAAAPRRPPALITPDELDACAVLGVPEDADAETIRAAHRRLVAAVHPDRGGSAELTRRVNAARDCLLAARGDFPRR